MLEVKRADIKYLRTIYDKNRHHRIRVNDVYYINQLQANKIVFPPLPPPKNIFKHLTTASEMSEKIQNNESC